MQYSKKEDEGWDIDSEGEVVPIITVRNSGVYEREVLLTPDPLNQSSLPEGTVQSWFKGKMGHSVTKYNPGQRYYYSPVGYLYEISKDREVLANFHGDGSIGQSCGIDTFMDTEGNSVIQNVCETILDNKELKEKIFEDTEEDKTFWGKSKKDVSDSQGKKFINELLDSYSEDTAIGQLVRESIRDGALNVLKEYYKNTGQTERYSGAGLTPVGKFNQGEELYKTTGPHKEVTMGKITSSKGELVDDKCRYTESAVHGTAENLSSVFASVDMEAIKYPDLIDDKWVISPGSSEEDIRKVLKARLSSALELYGELKSANKLLQFVVMDKDGLFHTTSNIENVKNLFVILADDKNDLQKSLDDAIKKDFTPLVEQPKVSEVEVWETGKHPHEEITAIKNLPLKRFGIFQPTTTTSEPSQVSKENESQNKTAGIEDDETKGEDGTLSV